MPAHQHCDLFYPLAGDLLGSAVNRGSRLSTNHIALSLREVGDFQDDCATVRRLGPKFPNANAGRRNNF